MKKRYWKAAAKRRQDAVNALTTQIAGHAEQMSDLYQRNTRLTNEVELLRRQLKAQCPNCGSLVGTKPITVCV